MFSAFLGGFMGFMGIYSAYKVVRSSVFSSVVEAAKQGWKEGKGESVKPNGSNQNDRGGFHEDR
jgi:hypothetical protein